MSSWPLARAGLPVKHADELPAAQADFRILPDGSHKEVDRASGAARAVSVRMVARLKAHTPPRVGETY